MPDTAAPPPPDRPPSGQLAYNVMQFCRTLRAAGLHLGPGHTLRALEAVEAIDLADRTQVYWALHAALITRHDQREVFDQAFHIFWRNPQLLERVMSLLLPTIDTGPSGDPGREISRRLAEALVKDRTPAHGGQDEETELPEVQIDASLTFSEKEQLQHIDFEQMTAEELERAKRVIAGLRLPIPDLRTRRQSPAPHGRSIDMRATLRRSLRAGGHGIDIARRDRGHRAPPLVVLCDISGSMAQYSRMLLHFLHAITTDRDRVHSFVFGTRLTNITRQLRHRDVDEALAKVGEAVEDWSGGTRIGKALAAFNRRWSRRVLGQGAAVLLITDGLDRDAGESLAPEVERLAKSCRRLIWLNPLLRWDGYAPKSSGARILIRHADDFRGAHTIASLEDLVAVLAVEGHRTDPSLKRWRAMAA